MTIYDDSNVAAFRDDALAYCTFIDAWRSGPVAAPYSTLLRLLSSLAKSGVALPQGGGVSDAEDVERIDHEQWSIIAGEIGDVTADAIQALLIEHADDEESLTRAAMLWDDLADIYRDLRHGLDRYAFGDADHITNAIWQWRFNYQFHWGAHLFRALATVHEIRFQLYME